MGMIHYMFVFTCNENTLFANKTSAKGRQGTKRSVAAVCEQKSKIQFTYV